MTLPITPQVFAILSSYIEEHTGIHYDLDEMGLLADKISARATEAQFESLLDYYYFLRYDAAGPAELDSLIDAVVVNETYFFRETEQLKALLDIVLQPLLKTGARPRIWCAAAATGEEPLTLAMMLDERGLLPRVEIVASDISVRALARAREGQYGARSMRSLPAGVEGRWLAVEGARAEVRADLRRAVDWRRVNLVDPPAVAALGVFDAIICRNVLIYFDERTTRGVVGRLGDALRPGGHLLVGASESLLRFGTRLSCEERGGAFFYRKVA